MNAIDRIFFEMDGVLADFEKGVRELAGLLSLNVFCD